MNGDKDQELDSNQSSGFTAAEELKAALDPAAEEKATLPNPATLEPLTPYNDEFYITHIATDEDVPIGLTLREKLWIKCDWESFSSDLNNITPESLTKLFEGSGELQEQFPQLGRDERYAIFASWRATQKALELLGPPPVDPTQRNNSFDTFSGHIKPLSEAKGTSMCSEYSLLVHHILDKAGVDSAVIVGAQMEHPDVRLADRHTYMVLEEQGLVFDPVYSASQERAWPPKVFRPDEPFTAESIKNMATEGEFGKKIKCTDLITGEERYYGSGAT